MNTAVLPDIGASDRPPAFSTGGNLMRVFVRQRSHSFDARDILLGKHHDHDLCHDHDEDDDPTSSPTKNKTQQTPGLNLLSQRSPQQCPGSMPKILRRVDSKDDLSIAPSLHSSTTTTTTASSLPEISPRSVRKCQDDSLLHQKSVNVVSHAKMSFVRVYVGLKTFLPRNKTVVIAIFFQPIVLVYEIICLDILDQEEVCRLYVYQTELIFQLHKRRALLELNQKKLLQRQKTSKMLLVPPPLSPQRKDDEQTSRLKRVKTMKKKIRRRTDAEAALQEAKKWQADQKAEELSPDDEDDIDLDSIDALFLLNTKSAPSSFFPKVILKCLKTQKDATGLDYRIQLINDLTLTPMTAFYTIPGDLKSVLPTFVNARVLIAQAKSLVSVHNATRSLKASVDSAAVCSDHAHTDLEGLQEEAATYVQEDSLNPNVLKWRALWQSSINAIIQRNRIARRMRCNWGNLIKELITEKREKDAVASEASARRKGEGGFRKLKIRTRRKGVMAHADGNNGVPFTPEAMAQYREEMAARKELKLKKERTTGLQQDVER
jgi:hypothetical protein